MQAYCTNTTQQHNSHRQEIEAQATLAKRRERWTYLKTNRIDKKNQTKILGKNTDLRVDSNTQRSENNTYKKNPSDTQRKILDAQVLTCPQTQADDQGEQHDGLRNRRSQKKILYKRHNTAN